MVQTLEQNPTIVQYIEWIKQGMQDANTPPKTACFQKVIFCALTDDSAQTIDIATASSKPLLIERVVSSLYPAPVAKSGRNRYSNALTAADPREEWQAFTQTYVRLMFALDAVPTLSDLSALTGHGFASPWISQSTSPQVQEARNEVMAMAEGLLVSRMDKGTYNVPFTIFQLKARHGWREEPQVLLFANKEQPRTLEELTKKYMIEQESTQKDTKE